MQAAAQTEKVVIPDHVRPDQVFEFDIYKDPGLLEDLHLGYYDLKRRAPEIFYTPFNGGHWMVTSSALFQRVLKDPANFSNAEIEIPKTMSPHRAIPINLDPPEHTPYRVMLMRHFTPKIIAGIEDRCNGGLRWWSIELIRLVTASSPRKWGRPSPCSSSWK